VRPGGQLLVTVWALEQEEPHRTLAKWTRVDLGAQPGGSCTDLALRPAGPGPVGGSRSSADLAAAQRLSRSLQDVTCDGADAPGLIALAALPQTGTPPVAPVPSSSLDMQPPAQPALVTISHGALPGCAAPERAMGAELVVGSTSRSGVASAAADSTDYMVPWNVPLHRPEVAAVARKAEANGAAAVGSTPPLPQRACSVERTTSDIAGTQLCRTSPGHDCHLPQATHWHKIGDFRPPCMNALQRFRCA
jgi:hypothetical protein